MTLTLLDIDNLSSAEYAKKMKFDPAFAAEVNALLKNPPKNPVASTVPVEEVALATVPAPAPVAAPAPVVDEVPEQRYEWQPTDENDRPIGGRQDDLTASDGAVVLIRRLPFVSLFGHFVYNGCRGRNGCGCWDCCQSYFLNGNGGCYRILGRVLQQCVDLRSECGVKLHLLGVFRRRQVVDVEQCQCHRILLRNFCYDASSANACPS